MESGLTLYTYWRSSAAYRVRIALALKQLTYTAIPVHLVQNGGEQWHPDYQKINPQSRVPTLFDGERVFHQSIAIIEYLDELYPEPSLLPSTPRERARVRGLAQLIACDIHPINNLRVLNQLEKQFKASDVDKKQWMQHWIEEGFTAFETLLRESSSTGRFCEGDQPSLADICMVPQVYNALRFDVSLDAFPIIAKINENCLSLKAFEISLPEKQADAE